MHLTVSELGALLLIGFVAAHILGIFVNLRAVAAFLGVVLIGSSGFVGRIFTDLGSGAQSLASKVMAWVVGVPVSAALAVIVLVFVAHDLHPKKTAGTRTGLLALVLGMIVVAGIDGIPGLNGLRNDIVSAAQTLIAR
jgi:hypothetical protein